MIVSKFAIFCENCGGEETILNGCIFYIIVGSALVKSIQDTAVPKEEPRRELPVRGKREA